MNNLRKYIGVLVAGLFLLNSPVFGQFEDDDNEGKAKKVSGGWGFFTPGYLMNDVAPLNAALTNMNVPAFESNAITLGGGGFLVISNFLIGGEGHSLISQEVNSGNSTARLDGGWGTFNVGYTPLATDWGLVVYPRVGIGAYNFELFLKDEANPAAFSDITDNASTASVLRKKGLLLTADVGINYSLAYKQGRGGGVFLGLDLGYNYVPRLDGWTLWDEEIQGGPGIDMSGFFVRLKVGGAGWHRQ